MDENQKNHLIFLTLTFFRGKRGIKVGPKVLTLDASLFHKNSNPSKKNSNNVLVCYSTTYGDNFGNIGPYLGGARAETLPKKDHII